MIIVRKVKENINRLGEIALRPNPLTTTNYVDMLIETEKQTAKEGFEKRIKHLEEIRQQAVLIEQISTEISDEEVLNMCADQLDDIDIDELLPKDEK